MVVGVMVTLVAMTVGLMVMLVAVLMFVLVMIMMVVLMLVRVFGGCFVAVEPGHIVIVVLELLCKLDVEIAGVDAMLVCTRNGNLRAATVMSPLMPEVPSMISVC